MKRRLRSACATRTLRFARLRLTRPACGLLIVACALYSGATLAAHAYAQFGDIKYAAGFPHFEWVNPNAPKGGEISLVPPTHSTNFDKYNPFTLKGTAP
ncbi:MAG TPA: hypothetical protein VM164_11855, partial [Burkholderiales bacterium]|nr:hypothetical protein [Burkholderiales bacterium]